MCHTNNELTNPNRLTLFALLLEQKSAIKLVEIGPRMTLSLKKVERGLAGGDVMYHAFKTKSKEEALMDKRKAEGKVAEKRERREKQEENVRRKKEEKEEKRMKKKAKIEGKENGLEDSDSGNDGDSDDSDDKSERESESSSDERE